MLIWAAKIVKMLISGGSNREKVNKLALWGAEFNI